MVGTPSNHSSDRPLIVGAGPVGLAAAMFLAREGIATRVIERADQPSRTSRALAVNPRTLELLEPTGVTERMLELGLPMRGAEFHLRDRVLFRLSFDELPHKYPFLLGLSQAVTERLLAEAMTALGGSVERGIEMTGCRNESNHAVAELRRTFSGATESYACPWLLGADGAHSVVRQSLGIDFVGNSFDRPWRLLDVPLETKLAEDVGHVFLMDDGGFLLYIRVVEDRRAESASPAKLWRLITNFPDLLAHLPEASPAGPVVWQSRFHIAHRLAGRLQDGRAYLAGDAAHIHSPVGARGMNLGIEDAFVLAQLAAAGEMERYDSLRRPVDAQVVRHVEQLTRAARGESLASRLLRRFVLPEAIRVRAFRRRMLALATGLDHDLPAMRAQEVG